MPTILVVKDWRVFFYSNEAHEPPHVHAQKAEAECKFWLDAASYDITEAWSHGLTPSLRRQIRKILFDHFELIMDEWHAFFGDR